MTEGKHTLGSYSFFNDAICKHYHALYNYNALPCSCSFISTNILNVLELYVVLGDSVAKYPLHVGFAGILS